MIEKFKCLVPDCDANRNYGRGLCAKHYSALAQIIHRGLTTWDDLQKRGKALQPNQQVRHSKIKEWALEGAETKLTKKSK